MSDWRPSLERLEGAYADATIRSYRSDFEHFAKWCRKRRLRALPATPSTVARFLDDQNEVLKASSLKRKLCAIRKLHLIKIMSARPKTRMSTSRCVGLCASAPAVPTRRWGLLPSGGIDCLPCAGTI